MKKYLVLHPVEEPAAMLEMVTTCQITYGRGMCMVPSKFHKCCKPKSVRVISATAGDSPCRVEVQLKGTAALMVICHHPLGLYPSAVSIHLAGKARTSPPAWERHSRQQFTRNKQTFSKALP